MVCEARHLLLRRGFPGFSSYLSERNMPLRVASVPSQPLTRYERATQFPS